MSQQLGVGTDGSEEERNVLKRDIVLTLGGSQVNLELTKEDLDHSLDRAIRELRRLSSPYTRGFFPVQVERTDQKTFSLTNKRYGHNKIARVLGVYRATGLWPTSPITGLNMSMQPWLYGMNSGVPNGDMLTYHLMASYIEELDTLLARRVTFNFNERSRVLTIHNRLGSREIVLLEAAVDMTEQDLMMDRKYRSWIERWAVAECQMKLAEIRGKFASVPGAGGSITLNATDLATRAEATFVQLREEVRELIAQDPTEFVGAFIAIG
jgi:hypothetical protein